ncbi:tetratricopeptide repeat protein [Streptomyces sp. VRA16 Mangrove soil]|uniref:tetratricopeptide repeat protein n=1 Tax=Streptomyces sp. VRA16 Mangrove soil TaxID=2817434 RepID=UPI001A9FD489|nr:tetratricopeptide repeat protein [Streptomyces sp. VRA16 Mangrove soil]MBO1332344.1 tetratricopeptide repeat protein [Streptomyces sp. VRA16 Mangrove soil]
MSTPPSGAPTPDAGLSNVTPSDELDALLARAVRLRESGHREQAREQLLGLRSRFPGDARVAYQTAWVHDTLGLEAEAVPHYVDAVGGAGLSAQERRGALLGLGSTYRTLGRHDDAVATLSAATVEFPEDNALKTFLSMALYNVGRAHDGMRLLLTVLAETSSDPDIVGYRPAIEYYAEDLDAVEGGAGTATGA